MSARGKDGFVKTFFVKKKYLARVKNLENVGMDPTILLVRYKTLFLCSRTRLRLVLDHQKTSYNLHF